MSYSPIPGGPPPPPGPPIPRRPPVHYGPDNPYRPAAHVKARKVGAPLAVLIILGIIAGGIIVLFTALNVVNSIIGIILASVAMCVVLLCYLWLDRWEPEPPRLLIFAFLWGAAVATTGALLIGLLLQLAGVLSGPVSGPVVQAPIVEEGMKGLFLLIMLTGRRRSSLSSLTDCLVYAGLVGAGFAWVEDILYIGENPSLGGALFTAALRLITGPFAHPLFTSMTAIGVWFSMRRRSFGGKAGCILLGYLGAMLLHGLWNGATSTHGLLGYALVYFLIMVPIFVIMIIVAIRARKREQQLVAGKLPGMVAAGLVAPYEAPWLASLRSRRLAIGAAERIGGKPAAKSVRLFSQAVIELAFIRDRIDRGLGTQETFVQQSRAAHAVVYARQGAPVLAQLTGFRLPAPGQPAPPLGPPPGAMPPPGPSQRQ